MPKKSKQTTLVRRFAKTTDRQMLPAVLVIAGFVAFGAYHVFSSHAATSDPWGIFTSPSPDPQSFFAGTDLADYPKLNDPAAGYSFAPQKATGDDSVYAFVKVSATENQVDAYDPLPGESVQTLYQSLKSQNVAGLIDPSATASNAYQLVDPGGAGGSNCWTNGYAHGECWAWKNNGYAHPQVYFIDHTSSQWPVAAATYKWNQAHGIDSVYKWATCPAISGIHCVPVNSGNYGDTHWMGHTTMYNSAGIMTSANIKLNTYYNGQYSSNLAHVSAHSACHEEGHALGLNHNSYYTSCMYPDVTAGSTVPTSQDFNLLTTIYSIRR